MGHSILALFTVNMDKIINLGIPHVAEQIFDCLATKDIAEVKKVSEAWKILAGKVLEQRMFEAWKDKVPLACETGRSDIVEVLLRRSDLGIVDFNARNTDAETGLTLACANGHL